MKSSRFENVSYDFSDAAELCGLSMLQNPSQLAAFCSAETFRRSSNENNNWTLGFNDSTDNLYSLLCFKSHNYLDLYNADMYEC